MKMVQLPWRWLLVAYESGTVTGFTGIGVDRDRRPAAKYGVEIKAFKGLL